MLIMRVFIRTWVQTEFNNISSMLKIRQEYRIEWFECGEFMTTGEIRSGRSIPLESVHASCPEYP